MLGGVEAKGIFGVLAEPKRREIVAALHHRSCSVGQLVEMLELDQPSVSKHLRVLREAKLVSMQARGQRRYYSLQREALLQLQRWLSQFTEPTDEESNSESASLAGCSSLPCCGGPTAQEAAALLATFAPPQNTS